MKNKFFILFFAILLIGSISALGLDLKPISASGELSRGIQFKYVFNFTNDSLCSNVITSYQGIFTTGKDGIAFVDLNLTNNFNSMPNYLCEYRGGNLRKVHKLSDTIKNEIYAENDNLTKIYTDTNNTIYWNGNAWSNTRWLNIDGSNANQDIDIGSNDITAKNGFFDYLGSLVNRITSLFVKDINASGNIDVAGNITASNFFGDGSHLTGISTSESDPLWTANQSSYSTTADIIAFGYYNSSDFVITDYFTKDDINNFNYYNSTDFDINNYFTSAEVLAFDYYNSSDFDINNYVTSTTLAGYNYYNSSDFVISNYATNVKVDSIGNFSAWNKDYNDLINKPTHLSNFTDDLGNRGYTHLTNFTNDLGIGNWTLDKPSYISYNGANQNVNLGSYNITASNFFGDGSHLTGISGGIVSEVNLTSGTYTGAITNGSYIGYKAGDEICNAEYPGSHFCNEFEVASWSDRTINNEDAWIIAGGPKYVGSGVIPDNDCNGFTYDGIVSYVGNYWHFNNETGGDGRAINCGTELPLCCAKY